MDYNYIYVGQNVSTWRRIANTLSCLFARSWLKSAFGLREKKVSRWRKNSFTPPTDLLFSIVVYQVNLHTHTHFFLFLLFFRILDILFFFFFLSASYEFFFDVIINFINCTKTHTQISLYHRWLFARFFFLFIIFAPWCEVNIATTEMKLNQ